MNEFKDGIITDKMFFDWTCCPSLLYQQIHASDISDSSKHRSFKKFNALLLKERDDFRDIFITQDKNGRAEYSYVIVNWKKHKTAFKETVIAMEKGVSRIYNGVLKWDDLCANISVLSKTSGQSKYGMYSYYPINVVGITRESLVNLQTGLYFSAYLLAKTQNVFPKCGKIILNNRSNRFDFKFGIQKTEREIAGIRKIVKGKKLYPVPSCRCSSCGFKETCFYNYIRYGRIHIIPDITAVEIKALQKNGIKYIEHILNVNDDVNDPESVFYYVPGLTLPKWKTWKSWAQAYVSYKRNDVPKHQLVPANLPVFDSQKQEVIISIYGDICSGKKILIGFLFKQNRWVRISKMVSRLYDCRQRREYWIEPLLQDERYRLIQLFFDGTESAEQNLVDRFMKILMGLYPYTLYYYGDYAEESLDQLMVDNHIPRRQEVRLRRSLVNLRDLVKNCLGIPTLSYSIQSVCRCLAESRYLGPLYSRNLLSFYGRDLEETLHNKWDVLYACRKVITGSSHQEILFKYGKNELEAIFYVLNALKDSRMF